MRKIIVYTDGGARGNPGPAGAGVYITDENNNEIRTSSVFLGVATNNFAEYSAVVSAFLELKKIIPKEERRNTHIEIRMDSELVKKQLSGEYQIKEETLFPLFIKIWNLRVSEFPNVVFTHIPRNKNKDADRLVNEAIDRE